jgi:pilus assembly protein CpaB
MRNRSSWLILALAVVLGLAAAFVAERRLSIPATAEAAPQQTVSVVIAKVELPIGSEINERQLDIIEWPVAYLPKGTESEPANLVGRVTRHTLSPNEPVLESALAPEGMSGGLSAVITEDKRAVSVKVDPVIGVAGFVTPGSRVDVLATLRRLDLQKPLPFSKVILEDVSVLAIDQKMEEARNGDPVLVSVVTLEVTPDQAQKLIYSAHEGNLQLALRNPSDHASVNTRHVGAADILKSEETKVDKPKRIARNYDRITVIKGTKITTERF